MPFLIIALTLFAAFMAADADAETDAERLAKKFSPILILTEDTVSNYGEDAGRGTLVLKPEPVSIMGVTSANNLRFWAVSANQKHEIDSYLDWYPPVENQLKLGDSRVNFSQNKFAFFVNGLYVGDPPGSSALFGQHIIHAYFDYPGTTPQEWNNEYTGSGAGAGANHPNTAYVHTYKRRVSAYTDSVTVIQYFYFYPYNDWWNNHEGDWQRMDVVVSSSDPNTAQILGVEYRFHAVWANYYKDWGSNAGLTDSFVFNPQNSLKLSQGTHPVVYVGAGSHAAFPVGGRINVFNALEIVGDRLRDSPSEDEVRRASGGNFEYMTHTGLVLSTQANGSHSNLWERYDLVMLPEPVLTNTDNMGLVNTMSWLGARIRWGTPSVNSPFPSANNRVPGNASPEKGPYNSNSEDWGESEGWGELGLFEVASKVGDPFLHSDLPSGDYHHWAIIGDETWSGTVSLYGDVVVFPGATLTIEPGTVVTFPSDNDRHQFREGNHIFSEIFVYGTLESKGTGSSFVSLGGDVLINSPDRWGGIHILGSGSLDLGDWTFFSGINPAKPRFLGSSAGDDWVSVRYDYGGAPFILEGKFTYETRLSADGGTTWSAWSGQSLLPGQTGYEDTGYEYREEGLREVTDYLLSVRAMSFSNPSDFIGRTSDTLLVRVRTLGTEDLGEVVLKPTSPRVGQAVTATLTDDDGYIARSVWTWEHRLVGGTTWTALTGSEDTAESSVYTPTALDLGKELRARVSYRDGHGTNTDMAKSAISAAVVGNQAPVITGSAAVSYAENAMVDVGRYTASDPDGHSIQWLALAGTDASHFELTGTDTDATRTLRFKRAPDFETKNTYSVALKVKDRPNDVPRAEDPNASLTTMLEVQVTVENADDPGVVELSSTQPVVGESIRATLTDPDGGETVMDWQWRRRVPGTATWPNITDATAAEYSPMSEDARHELQATVRYTDRHGSGKSAASDATEPVESVGQVPEAPAAKGLEATATWGQINLSWNAVSAMPEVSAYQVQYERLPAQPKPVVWPSDPTYVMQATINGQTSGQIHYAHRNDANGLPMHPGYRYRYQVRAQNKAGDGAWSEPFPEDGVIALADIQPRLQRLVLDDETTGLVVTWRCPYSQLCGPIEPDTPVASLTLQAQIKSGSSWSEDVEVTVDEETITHGINTLDRTAVHEFRTRAINADGMGLDWWSAAVALIPLSVESGADGDVTLDWNSPDGYGGLAWQYRYKASDNARWDDDEGRQRVSGGATNQTVTGLSAGQGYQFQVRARSGSTARVVSFIESSTLEMPPDVMVSYGSASYSAREGGDAVTITVQLSAAVDQQLSIPITAEGATEGDDFSDDLGGARELSFVANTLEQSFTITANEDSDAADERVTLGFGTLPSGVREGTPASATVTLIDTDPDGSVLLSTTQPQVDEPVTATLTDPDGGITGARWQWQRRADDTSAWTDITCSSSTRSSESSYPELSSCTPQSVDADYQLRATVSYVDDASADASDRQEAASAATEAVQDPSPVIDVTVSYGSASYSAREGGDAVTITVQLSAAVNQQLDIPITITSDDETDFSDDLGGVRELSFVANTLEESFTITANEDSDVADERVTLGFGTLPSGVSEGTPASATVTLIDNDPDGSVLLSTTQPQVDEPVTATLTDPDGGITGARWQWQRRADETSPWTDITCSSSTRSSESSYPELSSCTPQSVDVDYQLQATVSYVDDASADASDRQEAASAATEAVQDPSPVIDVTVSYGSASYSAREGGDAVTITVQLSAAVNQQLSIPITAEGATEGDDFSDDLGGVRELSFAANTLEESFTITANEDSDVADERVTLGFGTLPSGVSEGTPASATVTLIDNDEDPDGTVSLSETAPEVGDHLTATLTDLSGGVSNESWSWRRLDQGEVRTPEQTQVTSYHYTVEKADVGKYLEVTVRYDDAHGEDKRASTTTTAPVVGADRPGTVSLTSTEPQVGTALTATLTDDDGSITGASWQWQRRPNSSSPWQEITCSSSTRSSESYPELSSCTPQEVDEGYQLQATVSYNDGHGSGKSAESGPTNPVQARLNEHKPAISGPGSVAIAEGATGVLGTYTTSDDDGDRVTLSLTRTGGGPFSLNSAGELRVTSALDFESDETSYTVTLTATDDGTPSKSSTKDVRVEVTNVDETGTVTLSDTSPTVGDRLTATLSDPDGGIQWTNWYWQDVTRSDDADDSEPRSTSYPYVVQASDVGQRIQARVNYTDAQGSGKSASATTGVVQARPNEHKPAISGPGSGSIDEGTTSTLGTYTTSDDDGDRVTLSLTRTGGGPFSLNSAGELRVTSALDFESDNSYTVTLTATDDGTPSKSSTKDVRVEVTNVDETGTVTLSDTSPTVGDRLTATLSDPDGGIQWTNWYWQDVTRSDDADDSEPRSTSYPYVVQASDVGQRIQARVNYTDAQGSGKSASATTGVVQARPNEHKPAISGPGSGSIDEGTTSTLGTYTTSDDDGDRVTLSLTRTGGGPFSLNSAGELRVTSALDFESDNSYTVTLTATDDGTPSKSSTKDVRVNVTNVDETGTVSLTSSSPRVGDRLTASLSDPDGYRSGGSWSWQPFRRETKDGEDSWAEDESRESDEAWVDDTSVRYAASSYTVRSTDVGRRLRARISNYTDGHGSGKSANSSLTSRVQANVPGAPPNFSAVSNYGKVDLSWGAATANGSAIIRYEYRYKKSSESSWSSWTSVGLSTSVTVSDLEGGRTYNFEVRAVNGAGDGASSSSSDTLPRSPSAKPVSLQAMPDTLAVVAAPNPFNPSTTLHLQLPMRSVVGLTIYNLSGQVVRTLLDYDELDAGYHTIDWDGRNQQGQPVTSGVYLSRLRAGNKTLVSKLVLLR